MWSSCSQPLETKLISETSGVCQPELVAKVFVKDAVVGDWTPRGLFLHPASSPQCWYSGGASQLCDGGLTSLLLSVSPPVSSHSRGTLTAPWVPTATCSLRSPAACRPSPPSLRASSRYWLPHTSLSAAWTPTICLIPPSLSLCTDCDYGTVPDHSSLLLGEF